MDCEKGLPTFNAKTFRKKPLEKNHAARRPSKPLIRNTLPAGKITLCFMGGKWPHKIVEHDLFCRILKIALPEKLLLREYPNYFFETCHAGAARGVCSSYLKKLPVVKPFGCTKTSFEAPLTPFRAPKIKNQNIFSSESEEKTHECHRFYVTRRPWTILHTWTMEPNTGPVF